MSARASAGPRSRAQEVFGSFRKFLFAAACKFGFYAIRRSLLSSPRPAPSPLKLKQANDARRTRSYLEARALSLAIPDDGEVHLRLARAALDSRDPYTALDAASKAVKRSEANSEAHLLLGRALVAVRQLPDALTHLRRAAELAPNSAEPQLQLGAALLAQRDLPGAEAAYREAMRLSPRSAAAIVGLLNARTEQSAPPSELEDLGKKAIALDPAYPDSYPALARVYIMSESEPDKALAVLEQGLERNPAYAPTRHMLALALLHYSGERPASERAEAEAGAAIALDPDMPAAYITLGRAQIKLGKPREALSPLFKSLALSPSPEVLFVLSDAYARAGDTQKAAQWRGYYAGYSAFRDKENQLNVRIAREPANASHYLALAEEYEKIGALQGAVSTLELLIRRVPNVPGVAERLSRLRGRLGAADAKG